MRRFSLILLVGLAMIGFTNNASRAACCGGEEGASCGCEGGCGGGCSDCQEPYCCDHTCNSGWVCGGGCSCDTCCRGLLFPWRSTCDWRRWRPCESCGCESCGCESCGPSHSCGCHECSCHGSSGCESCGCSSCGCHESCGCESCGCESCGCGGCGCCRCCLFPSLFPWLRGEHCKGAGERYGCGSQCGCGDLYINDWRSQPPRCEPCSCCGNWVGPGEPMPSYQLPRAGSDNCHGNCHSCGCNHGYASEEPYEEGSSEGVPTGTPQMAPPSSPPPTTLPPLNPPASNSPMHTTQRPSWSAY
jgi:hypothetical protein